MCGFFFLIFILFFRQSLTIVALAGLDLREISLLLPLRIKGMCHNQVQLLRIVPFLHGGFQVLDPECQACAKQAFSRAIFLTQVFS